MRSETATTAGTEGSTSVGVAVETALAPAGRRRTRARGRRALVVALLAAAMLALALGAGLSGVVAGTSASSADGSTLPAVATSVAASDGGSENLTDTVVVRYADDHVVTGEAADETPMDEIVTADDADLVVGENGYVETEYGTEVAVNESRVRVADADPDLVVSADGIVNDTLVVDREDDGLVKTEEGESVVTAGGPLDDDGEPVEFDDYDESYFEIDDVDADNASEGETLEVTADVTNRKYAEATQTINLSLVDGTEETTISNQTAELTLEGGESTTETFEYETQFGDHGAADVMVESENDTEYADVTISEAEAQVEIVDTTAPAAGDELEVTAEVDRRGNYPHGDQEYLIDLRVDGEHVTTKPVLVEPGGETVETFTYETTDEDPPDVDVEVESNDHTSDSETVIVYGQATHEENVQASFTGGNLPDEGDTLELTSEIEYDQEDRIPDDPQEYPIELSVDDEFVDNATVELDGDETVTETFTYETEDGDAPRVDAELETPGSGDTTRPRINGSGFGVTIEEMTGSLNETEELVATVSIENTGEIAGEQDVRMRIDSSISDPLRTTRQVRDRTTVSLNASERTTERLSYRTDEDDVPEMEVAILSDDDEAIERATVRPEASRYEPENLSGEYTNDSDRELTLSSEINNTGTEPGDQYVEFTLDDELVHVDRVTLGPWESETVSTTIDAPEEIGAYNFEVATDDQSANTPVAVGVELGDGDDPITDPDDGSDSTENESSSESTSETEPPDDDGLPWYLALLGVLGVLASIAVLLVYRNDPENFPPEPATVPTALQEELHSLAERVRAGDPATAVAAAKRLVGLGAGTLVVQNDLPREATVRVRCQTADDTVFLEDFELQPEERRDLGSLPDTDQFTVGAGVDDITAHEEVFQGASGDVGVVLRAEGIVIANLS